MKTFFDDQLIADLYPRSYRPDVDLAVRRDDADLVSALELIDRALRDDQRSFSNLDGRPHLAVLAWPEEVAGIRESALDGDRARSGIDLAIGHDHLPAVRVRAAVVEDEVQHGVIAPRGLRPVVALGGAKVFYFADVELGLDRVDLRDRRHDRGRAHEAPDLRLGNAHDAVDRRSHLRPAAVELSLR